MLGGGGGGVTKPGTGLKQDKCFTSNSLKASLVISYSFFRK